MNFQPLFAFGHQRFFAFRTQGIVFSFASAIRFLPFGFDELLAFEPVEHGVKHSIAPFDVAAREFADFLEDFVPVTLAISEDGQHERFGGSGNQIFRKHGSLIH